MSATNRRGWWFALEDTGVDREPLLPWRPCLQTDGVCAPLDVRFATQEQCERFIRKEVVGVGIYGGTG